MADKDMKYADNAAGKFFVDESCIDCDACRDLAPRFFKRNDEGGFSYVYRQPESDEDSQSCQDALEGCPVEAIGDDGE